MLIRDANANFFIVFGGLFSRKIVEQSILKQTFRGAAPAQSRTSLGKFFKFLSSGTGVKEVTRLQPKIIDLVNEIGQWDSVEKVGTRGDILCEKGDSKILIETKVQKRDRLDEAIGSGVNFAEDQLIRDLGQRGLTWGVLTNGWSWRFYHRDFPERTIEFCLSDICHSLVSQAELDLFCAMLSSEKVLNELFKKSSESKTRSTSLLSNNLRLCYLQLLDQGWDRDFSVRFLLRFSAQRFLEDCGILNILDKGYGEVRLDAPENYSHENLLDWLSKSWTAIGNGRWTMPIGEARKVEKLAKDFFSSKEAALLRKQPEFVGINQLLLDTFCPGGEAIDCSDLDIEFFGNFYQLVEDPTKKNEAGRYFTNLELARRLSTYLSERYSRKETLRDGDYLLDPACGSGQLLRLLIPYALDFVEYNPEFPTKLDHWRRFASHLAGLDNDLNCVWITKMSLWLATAAKGRSFVDVNVRDVNVVKACVGKSKDKYKGAMGFSENEYVVGIITNPPWEELRIQFNQYYKKKTGKSRPKQSDKKSWDEYQKFREEHQSEFDRLVNEQSELNLTIRQCFNIEDIPNLAEVFLIICHDMLASESEFGKRGQLPYAIILPDQFFVGTRMKARDKYIEELDYYIPFARNIDPSTGQRYFFGVDPNRRFGIILGKVNQKKKNRTVVGKPLSGNEVSISYDEIGMLPLPSSAIELTCLERILSIRNEVEASWFEGEWHGTLWEKKSRRVVKKFSENAMPLIKAEGLGSGYGLSFSKPDQVLWWVKSEEPSDVELALSKRIIVGDTKRNAGKIVRAGFIEGGSHKVSELGAMTKGVALQNKLLYSVLDESWVPYYNSIYFELAMRCIAGASNLNAWRFNLFGLPEFSQEFLNRLGGSSYIRQQVLIADALELSEKEFFECIEASAAWLENEHHVGLLEEAKNRTQNEKLLKEIDGAMERMKQAEQLEREALKKKAQIRKKKKKRTRRTSHSQ